MKLNIIVFYGEKKNLSNLVYNYPQACLLGFFFVPGAFSFIIYLFSHLKSTFLPQVHFQYKKRKPVLTNQYWVGGRTSGAPRSPSCLKTKMGKKKKKKLNNYVI